MASTTPTQASHLNTKLLSPTHPIYLRVVLPSDAPRHAALISDPANGWDPSAAPLTAEWSTGAIAAQRESAAQPTVLDSSSGKVESGPGRVNMVVVERKTNSSAEGGQEEVVIGLGGYGAIKDWVRDGRKIRAGDAGVMLDPSARGKGYAVESMRLAIEWAFTPVAEGGPQLDIVTITTAEGNSKFIRLTEEKLGLKGRGELVVSEFDKEKKDKYWEVTEELWEELRKGTSS